MGAYDSNPSGSVEDPPPPPRAAGGPRGDVSGADELACRISGLAVADAAAGENLLHVMDAAETTIKEQWEENNRLKDELMQKTRELERIMLEATSRRNSIGLLGHQQNGVFDSDEPSLQASTMNQQYSEGGKANGNLRKLSREQTAVDNGCPSHSQLSTPSSRSLSPTRHRKGEYDSRFNFAGQGLMQVSEMSSNILWKQDLVVKVKEHEEEISQLRKHLADYSMKEARILSEKSALEKRIAYMRMAFDQQQQDLVDAASKALSYRQDIIEENIRLTYALQAAHQERSTFISSLLPILSEYGLQPPVLDAQSIVGSLKVLFKHLQEKLIITEEKLKESQYQIAAVPSDFSHNTSIPLQSPPHPLGQALVNSSKSGLDIVPQPAYSHVQSPISSPTVQGRDEWDMLGIQNRHVGPTEISTRNLDNDNSRRISLATSKPAHDVSARESQSEFHVRFNLESKNQNPSFKDLVQGDILEDSEGAAAQHAQEASAQWGPGSSPDLAPGLDDPNPSYPYLPTVVEEPSSSFSEAAEDDPLPAIEGLRITGEAFPGRQLQASGYSIHGTTSCNFEWVRHLEDGSVNYIEGAKQPDYLVTADDVDSLLAIEVQPLDDRKRKGELVKVFANEQRKIICDLEMHEQIKKTLSAGHVSYEVLLSVRFIDIWEPAILAIKREGYSIKCNGPPGVVVTEKFQQATTLTIPYGRPTEFSIQASDGSDYILKTTENGPLRDTIVLILRLFRMTAVDKRKIRKRGLFFK